MVFRAFSWSNRNKRKPTTPPPSYSGFCLIASPEVIVIIPLRYICCRRCGTVFCVCQSCWRGQAYCCDFCRITAKRALHREAQRRYRQTLKGKIAHCKAEQRRRIKKTLKSVDDPSSTPPGDSVIPFDSCPAPPLIPAPSVSAQQPRCHFCGVLGQIVPRFPARGYGRARRTQLNLHM